jgi:hypothetical protein
MQLFTLEMPGMVGDTMSPEETEEFKKVTAERDELKRIVDELRAEINRLSQIAKY